MKKITSLIICLLFLISCLGKSGNSTKKENPYDNTPASKLFTAIKNENISEIEKIIKSNSRLVNFPKSFHKKYENYFPLLSWTIKNDKYLSFKALLELGADVNILSKRKWSPLMYASFENDIHKDYFVSQYIVDLLNYKADVNYVCNGFEIDSVCYIGGTALNTATLTGNLPLIKYLIKNGADVNQVIVDPSLEGESDWKYNALMTSISHKRIEITKYLLIDCKADYNWNFGLDHAKRDLNISYFLRLCYFLKDSEKYRIKQEILEFLEGKDIGYRKTAVPERAINFAKLKYPNQWKQYLKEY